MSEKKKYMISIVGTQKLDDDTDTVEVLTTGNYMMKNGHFFIGYKEYDQDNPDQYFDNLVKLDGDVVTISRKGSVRSQLMLEKGKRHQCLYESVAGTLAIGVFTRYIISTLNEKGGTLEVSYTLDSNNDLLSENSFKITVEEKESIKEVE